MLQPPDAADDGLVRSLTHALLILEQLAAESEPVPLRELTALVDMPKSTVHRILTTLRARRFVTQEAGTGRYAIGPMAWVVGSRSPVIERLREAAREPLAGLRRATGEAVFVTALSDEVSVLIEFIGGLQAVTVADYGRSWTPAWATAAGRAALAHRSPKLTDRTIESVAGTEPGAPSSAQLGRRLAEIRSRGWELERTGEATMEIAAPVRDHAGAAAGAAGVVLPLLRGESPEESLLAAVRRAADRISEGLGYLPQPNLTSAVP